MTGDSSNRENRVSRRGFLKGTVLAGGAALASLLLPSCLNDVKQAQGLSSPAVGRESPMVSNNPNTAARVALVRTRNRKEGVLKALSLLGINPVRGKAVMLKPNFNTADPFPASTHNDTLSTLITTLKDMGAQKITIAERSGPADTRDVMGGKAIFRMAEELGFDIINLEEMKPDGWVKIKPPDSHWRDGFLFARPYREAECIVSTCCLKGFNFRSISVFGGFCYITDALTCRG